MKIHLLAYTFCVLPFTAALAAAEEAPAEAPSAGYHLKNRSSFSASEQSRAPFWPIGWAPAKGATGRVEVATPGFELKPEQFAVTSIFMGAQSLAVINGRSYGEGETLKSSRAAKGPDGNVVPGSGLSLPPGVKVRIQRINDGDVVLQAGGQSISVPLRRPELASHKPQEDILAQDEK